MADNGAEASPEDLYHDFGPGYDLSAASEADHYINIFAFATLEFSITNDIDTQFVGFGPFSPGEITDSLNRINKDHGLVVGSLIMSGEGDSLGFGRRLERCKFRLSDRWDRDV